MFSLPRSNVSPTRRRIDEAYTHLHQLLGTLDGKVNNSTQPNPHGLRIEESNELISGLKKLFNERSTAKQVRLMTIALKRWGHKRLKDGVKV